MNRKAIDYGVLRARRPAATADLREPAAARERDRRFSGELKTSNIRVVDEAERPRSPVPPERSASNLTARRCRRHLPAVGLAFFLEYRG